MLRQCHTRLTALRLTFAVTAVRYRSRLVDSRYRARTFVLVGFTAFGLRLRCTLLTFYGIRLQFVLHPVAVDNSTPDRRYLYPYPLRNTTGTTLLRFIPHWLTYYLLPTYTFWFPAIADIPHVLRLGYIAGLHAPFTILLHVYRLLF